MSAPIVIGIAGNSCAGKTRLCRLIQDLFGADNVCIFPGDNYHIAERYDPLWDKTTHLDPVANLLDEYARDLEALKRGETVRRREYQHSNGKFGEVKSFAPKPVIVAEGLHTLYTQELRSNIDISIFFEIDEALRQKIKIERDVKLRGYTPSKAQEQIERRIPDAKRYIEPQKEHANIAFTFSTEQLANLSFSDIDASSLNLVLERITDSTFVENALEAMLQHNYPKNGYHCDPEGKQLRIRGGSLAMQAHQFASLAKQLQSGFDMKPAAQGWQGSINGFMQLVVFLLLLEQGRAKSTAA